MSGYFQRLMARGAGTDALIHPLSRLPYAAIPESEPLGEGGDLATAPRAWEQPQGAVGAPGPHHEDPAALASVPSPPSVRTLGLRKGNASVSHKVPSMPAALASVLSPPFIRTFGLGKGIASVPHEVPSMPAAPGVEAQTAVSQQPPLERVEEYTVNEASESFRLMTPRTLANAVAPFGLPPESAAGRVQAAHPELNNRPSVRAPKNQPGMSAAPEVHVTIGRIEVTAVTAAPAPRRATTPRKSAMSLDDYLARRQRGEP